MKRLRTKTATTFYTGLLKLDEATAKRHARTLESQGEGVFEVIAPTQIKGGIELEYEGEATPLFMQTLVDLDPETEPKKKAAKVKA